MLYSPYHILCSELHLFILCVHSVCMVGLKIFLPFFFVFYVLSGRDEQATDWRVTNHGAKNL